MAQEHTNHKSMTIVADWQDRSSKKQMRFNSVLVFALAIAFLATATFFYWSKREHHELIVSNNMKYLQICGVQEADRVEAALDEGVMLISNIAGRYSTMRKLLPDTSVTERLELLADAEMFDRLGHVSPDGTDTTLEGIADVSDREYFQRAMRGESGYEFLKSSRVTGRPCVVFYAPIYAEESDDIQGVMIGFYETERLNNLFSMGAFDYAPNAYLLLGDGSVVANSMHDIAWENMLDELAKYTFHGDISFEDVEKAIAHKTRTSIMFEFIDSNNKPSVGVITQLQTCDWMILSHLPGRVTSNMIDSVNDIGRGLMLAISSVFIILIVAMFIMISREERRTKAEMLDTQSLLKYSMEQEKKQTFIVDTLAKSYSSVYLINMRSQTCERIEERQASSLNVIPAKGKWQDSVNIYVREFVDEPYKEMVTHFLDAACFDEYLADRDIASMECMRIDCGWRKLVLLAGQREQNGKLRTVIFAVQGIADEKEKELLAQKALKEAFAAVQFASNAKTTFLSNMSHDIRTPMNAIIGMTTIASANLDNRERVADCLRKITMSGKHLLGLINEILDMSKIESGQVDLNEEAFSLTELVEEMVSMNQVLIKEKNHRLSVRTDELVHADVIGDKIRLQQVFMNMLTNAIKYTPAGGNLEITVSEDSTGSPTVGKYLATFRDNGIGMSQEYMEKLFEPFTRARDNRLIGIQGTGLGMPIARNIVRMMNGDIEVESELNKGSCFKVSFLLKLQPDAVAKAADDPGANEETVAADFSGKRVLLVEDNELNMEIAVEILSMLGLEVDTAENGQRAVDAFTAAEPGKYALIFMDVQMPVLNGYEATEAIRASAHPEAQTIPIVAMTANAFASDVRAARNAGMNDHIAKPIDISNVTKVLTKHLKSAN